MRKSIFSKTISILTAFAMTFNVAFANGNNKITICHYPPGNQGNPQTITIAESSWPAHQAHGDTEGPCAGDEEPVCDPIILVSKGGENGFVSVDPIHTAWTAQIDGAEWIWTENPISDAVNETTETFVFNFSIDGDPEESYLEIAADNSYKVILNGNQIAEDNNENNHSSVDNHTILSEDLLSGNNTIEFEVRNWAQAGGTMATNPAGLMFKLTINCSPEVDDHEDEDPIEENYCEPWVNLIINGGFENPVVIDSKKWQLFANNTPGLGWEVEWISPSGSAPADANLELQKGVNGWVSHEGDQHAELDTDYGSPAGGSASVRISQEIATVPGNHYQISYAFSPRPGEAAGENILNVLVNGATVQTQGPIAGGANTSWTNHTFVFTASGSLATIAFEDGGISNSKGTFLDNVSVNCIEDYVEPEDPCEGEECEPTDPTDPIEEPEYCLAPEFVETVTVNPNGTIYPSSELPAGDYLLEANGTYKYRGGTNLEADAAFSQRLPSDLVNLQLDPLNYTYEPWYQSNSFNSITGNTGSLGIWVNGNGPAWGTVFNPSHQYFHEAPGFVGGQFTFQITDNNYNDNTGHLTVTIWDCNEEEGTDEDEEEDITPDDDGEEGEEDTTPDSEDENDENDNPNNNPSSSTGGSSSSGGSLAGLLPVGQVLGDSTEGEVLGACVQFENHYKRGDKGGEIPKIQEFLNEHMNAGLKVDGIYGNATTKAVHAFQQKYFQQIISPWVPPLKPLTTGRWYKTTKMMANEIIDCPEEEVFLEDPKIMYKVQWGNR